MTDYETTNLEIQASNSGRLFMFLHYTLNRVFKRVPKIYDKEHKALNFHTLNFPTLMFVQNKSAC